MKYLLVIGDGMADNPVPQLGGKTPLQAASIPTIDRMAARGLVGSVVNCPKPLPAGSETAILSIFGCDPRRYFTGRSPMEAAAVGIQMLPGDAAFRCNLVTLEDGDMPLAEKRILSHSAGSIDGESALASIGALLDDPRFAAALAAAEIEIHRFPAFRQLAIQHHSDIRGIRFTPPHDHLDEKAGPYFPTGNSRAETFAHLMRRAHETRDHPPVTEARRQAGKLPANGIWFWAEGTAVELPSFQEQYGCGGAVVSAVPLCHGIGVLRGLEMVEVEGATGELATNFPGKLEAIEWLDSRLVSPLLARLEQAGEDCRILLLSDHKTLTATRGHDGDPVPFLIYDSRRDTGRGGVYDEPSGEAGLFVEDGSRLLDMLFEKQAGETSRA